MPDKLLSTAEVATIKGLHVNNISLRCRQGKIKGAVQIGGRWLIPEESLEGIKTYPEKKNKRYSPS